MSDELKDKLLLHLAAVTFILLTLAAAKVASNDSQTTHARGAITWQ